ncbi:hypothetical protein, partial [Brucella sp. NF 2653]|uniref:hypothetical protein n=1 Tax=Brucella sp. NF 2653 TaxID=693748 RepID=UPI001AEC477F
LDNATKQIIRAVPTILVKTGTAPAINWKIDHPGSLWFPGFASCCKFSHITDALDFGYLSKDL